MGRDEALAAEKIHLIWLTRDGYGKRGDLWDLRDGFIGNLWGLRDGALEAGSFERWILWRLTGLKDGFIGGWRF